MRSNSTATASTPSAERFKLPATSVAWYADEGVSAHTDDVSKRPQFHQLVRDAEAWRFDAVVVHKLDRFARSVVVALSTFKRLNELGISFLSLSEQGMDFTTPMGKVMFGMISLLAEYYSENLGLETKKGKAERRAKGLHNGLVPFGYRTGLDGVAEVDPETKDGAELAFQLAAEGKSLAQIVQALNARGYRTAGNMRRAAFTKDTVRDMLANRFYLGKLPVFEPAASRRVRGWQDGRHPALIDEETFRAARVAIEGRRSATKTRRAAPIYSVSGLLRCSHCGERMRAVRPPSGRVRYHCRSKAQSIGCTGGGSFLDTYEQQLVDDLRNFVLPDDWQRFIVDAGRTDDPKLNVDAQRRQLEARLERITELYRWGHLSKEQYLPERERLERELAHLTPQENGTAHLTRLADYVQSLPAAWADADQEQRNQLASLLYAELWVDGPRLLYVKPRPEVEPLFQLRAGAAQPTKKQMSELSHSVRSGDPDGGRGRMIQQWDFPVDEPVLLPEYRQSRVRNSIHTIAARISAGESRRALAHAYGVSHETIRRELDVAGITIEWPPVEARPLRRTRQHHLPGRGRSVALAPDEVLELVQRYRAGASLRSLARSVGISHETMRRVVTQASHLGRSADGIAV